MDKLELQKLRELPIEGVAERLGLQVTRHKALCPFHDDHHASLSFSVRRNTFRCFVCNTKGGTIDLVMKYLNLGFKEACRWLNYECRMMNAECGMQNYECGMRNYECGIGAKPSSASRHSELTSSNASHFRIPNSELKKMFSHRTASSAIAQVTAGDAVFLHRLLRDKSARFEQHDVSPAEKRRFTHRETTNLEN